MDRVGRRLRRSTSSATSRTCVRCRPRPATRVGQPRPAAPRRDGRRRARRARRAGAGGGQPARPRRAARRQVGRAGPAAAAPVTPPLTAPSTAPPGPGPSTCGPAAATPGGLGRPATPDARRRRAAPAGGRPGAAQLELVRRLADAVARDRGRGVRAAGRRGRCAAPGPAAGWPSSRCAGRAVRGAPRRFGAPPVDPADVPADELLRVGARRAGRAARWRSRCRRARRRPDRAAAPALATAGFRLAGAPDHGRPASGPSWPRGRPRRGRPPTRVLLLARAVRRTCSPRSGRPGCSAAAAVAGPRSSAGAGTPATGCRRRPRWPTWPAAGRPGSVPAGCTCWSPAPATATPPSCRRDRCCACRAAGDRAGDAADLARLSRRPASTWCGW